MWLFTTCHFVASKQFVCVLFTLFYFHLILFDFISFESNRQIRRANTINKASGQLVLGALSTASSKGGQLAEYLLDSQWQLKAARPLLLISSIHANLGKLIVVSITVRHELARSRSPFYGLDYTWL